MVAPLDWGSIWALLAFWQRELLLFSAIWFLIGALDDLAVDGVWALNRIGRWLSRYRSAPPMRATDLPLPANPGLIAVFIAAWREEHVIGAMLTRCRQAWEMGNTDFRIYVGCYPNDFASTAAILCASKGSKYVRLVLCQRPGPTTKADCLNHLWRALVADELSEGIKAKAVLLHDAEDMVHSDELRVFDYLIERATAVQLPVIPFQVEGSAWISGHYCDEFAEAHGKSLVVREAIGAALPMAGVGCAIGRNHIGRIALENGGAPFDASSLTEDYELGLGVKGAETRAIFARIMDASGELVATRACFPDTLGAAVKQKGRWMTGIALAGWDRLGWDSGIAEAWMRLRDRRAVLAAIVLTAAYICIALTAMLVLAEKAGLYQTPPFDPMLVTLLWVNALMLLWRLLVRAAFVGRLYGWRQALLSMPRTIIANIIAIMAARRACTAYVRHLFGRKLEWDKTSHSHFPKVKSGSA
jgi:bacteriophage N4 adsorption protein B